MKMKKIVMVCTVVMASFGLVNSNAHGALPANFPTVTTYIYDANIIADGYTFLAVAAEVEGIGYYVLIVDNDGNIVWYKEANDDEIYDFKVLPNGHLHYAAFIEHHSWTGGGDAIHVILDENFNEVEVIDAGNGYVAESHDFQMLPNGHALLIGYYMSEVDVSQIVDGGHPGAIVSGAIVQELDGNKDNRNVVFQWRTWDAYAFEDSVTSKRAVINAFHFNTINQDFDGQIFTSGIRKLNRQTGEVMYILGGSENEFTFVGADADPSHVGGHAFHRLASGNVMNFDNGRRESSRVHEYAIDEPNKVATHIWTYTPEPEIRTYHRGNAKRLPNGNTFIGWGGAMSSNRPIPTCTEVSPDGRKVFEIYFDHPDVESYRAFRFPYPPSSQAIEDTESDLAAGNTYVFDDTGVAIEVVDLTGDATNELKVTREPYAPVYPEFSGKAPRVLQVRVKIAQSGITSMTAKISLDAESFELLDNFRFDDPSVLTVYHRQIPGQGLFVQLPTSYNPVTKQLSTTMTEFGELIFCFPDIEDVPYAPMLIETESYRGIQEYMVIAAQMAEPNEQYPVNQELPILLSWTPKGFARSYHLQVAKDENFNNIVVEETFLTEARYIFETAEPDTTYYYRVNTTNEGGTSGWSVGSFATVPPMIIVTAPNGREQWKRGLDYFIRWYDNIAEDVVIELYKGDTLVRTIGMVLSDRAYEWEVDLDLEPGCDYSIKIKSSTDETLFDMSDGTFAIDPADTTPPEFEFSVTPTVLWPPNHKMVLITPSWTVSDETDPTPEVSLVSIVSNEDDDALGDGHTGDDIQIGDDGSVYLRAERSGTESDRIYTITYEAVDDCGNSTILNATVVVPHELKSLEKAGNLWIWRNHTGDGPGKP